MPPRKRKETVSKEQVDRILKEIGSRPLTPRMKAERAASAAKESAKAKTQSDKGVRESIKRRQEESDASAKAASSAAMKDYYEKYGKPGTAKAEQVKKAQADKRRTRLSDDGQEWLNTSEKADKDSGKKQEDGRFTKVLNVLLSPSRATAEAARQNQETFYRSLDKGDGVFKALGKGFVEGADDFLPNIKKMKPRTTFSDVIQDTADNLKAKSEGKLAKDTKRGDYKFTGAGRVGKAIAGFTLDVFSDPTTYIGTGLVTRAVGATGKVMKSGEAASLLEETASVIKNINAPRGAGDKIAHLEAGKILAVDKTPVKVIKKKDIKALSPEARVLYEFAKAEQKATKWSTKGAANTAHIAKNKTVFGEQAELTIKAARQAEITKFMSERAAKGISVAAPIIKMDDLADEGLRKIAQKTIDEELAFLPNLGAKIKTIGTAADDTFKSGHHAFSSVDGNVSFKALWGSREEVQALMNKLAPDHMAIPVKTPEDMLKYVTIHELGHQVAYNLPKNVDKAVRDELRRAFPGGLGEAAEQISRYSGQHVDETIAEIWAAYRFFGDKSTGIVRTIGTMMEQGLKSGSKQTIEESAEIVAKQAKKFADDAMAKAGLSADDLAEEMAVQTLRNLAPETTRRVSLRLGKASVALPPLGIAAAARKVGEVEHVKKSVDYFHAKLNANYGVIPGLTRLRNAAVGMGTSQIRSEAVLLKSVFDPLKKPERKGMMKAWRQGVTTGSYKGGIDIADGQPVDDALAYFDDSIKSIENSITNVDGTLGGITHQQLMSFLPQNMRWDSSAIKFGEGWLANTIRQNASMGDDPAQILFLMRGALAHAAAKKSMWQTFGAEFGVPIGKVGLQSEQAALVSKTAKALQKKGYTAAVDANGAPISHLSGQLFHPEVAASITRLDAMFKDPKTTSEFMREFDKVLQGWKGLVTRYNPSFHVRTLLGEAMMSYLGGMRSFARSHADAIKVMKGRNTELMGRMDGVMDASNLSPSQINASNILAMGPDAPAAARSVGNSATVLRHKTYGDLSADYIWHAYQQSGLKSGFASADLMRDVGPLRTHVGGKINDAVQLGTEGVEDYGRLAHFIDVIRHSKARTLQEAVDEAAEVVTKMHLDYTAVTGLEKSVMTRIMPFYKWIRLSTPLMVEHLMHQPGKALVVPKTMMMASELAGYDIDNFGAFPGGPDAVVPEWLRSHGAVPVFKMNGNNNYFDPTALFPLASSVDATDPGKTFGMLNPAIRMTGELGLNTSSMGAPPFNDIKSYLLRQLPQTNYANNMATGGNDPDITRFQRTAQFLTNPGIQPNTPDRMNSETYRMRNESIAARDKKKAKEENKK